MDDVVCDFDEEGEGEVELVVVVEVEIDAFVEIGVCEIEMEGLVETEMYSEYSPSVSLQLNWSHVFLVHLLYSQS